MAFLDGVRSLATGLDSVGEAFKAPARARQEQERVRLKREADETTRKAAAEARQQLDATLQTISKLRKGELDAETQRTLTEHGLRLSEADHTANITTRILPVAAATRKDVASSAADDEIRKMDANQRFMQATLGQVKGHDMDMAKLFLGSKAPAEEFFDLQRQRLDMDRQAQEQLYRKPDFLEVIAGLAPSLTRLAGFML